MNKRNVKPKLSKQPKRNPFGAVIKLFKPIVIKSKKIYSRKGKKGDFNAILHRCRGSLGNWNFIPAVQAGYKKGSSIRHFCGHWSKRFTNRNVRWHIRRNDGRSNSRLYYINRSVLHEKTNRMQKATTPWFKASMGDRTPTKLWSLKFK